MKKPAKINLSLDLETKRKAFALATAKGISISRLFKSLVEDAEAATKG